MDQITRDKISASLKGNTIMRDAIKRGYKVSKETKQKISMNRIYKTGQDNPLYKGKNGSYNTQHRWIRKEFKELNIDYCENCQNKNAAKYDCANISGDYKTSLDDWVYLCRLCHALFDDVYRNRKRDNLGRFTNGITE